ncbi:hypothetical protein [Microcystis phage Mae-JY09]
MATEVASAYVSIDAKTAGLHSGLAAADARVRGFSANADAAAARAGGAFSRMGRLMRNGALVGGAAIATALGSAVKVAADFEQTLAKLRAVSGAGAADMAKLESAALDLGASTKFSAREVAAAQVELAKAGMSTAEILDGSLTGALALAAAGEIELAQAASTVVNTMGQFGLAAGDAGRIADALAEAANATTADVGDMAMALENVGPSAKAAGLSFEQTVVALELLAKSGTMGAEAGTNLKSMLNTLASPTDKAQKLMGKLGLSFFDANGQFKDMDVVAGDLRQAFAGLTNEQKLQYAQTLAGTYGQKALLSIMEGGPKAARAYERGLSDQGQAARIAAIQNDTLAGKIEQLGGAMETIQIKLGKALIPLLADAAVAGAELLDSIGDSDGFAAFAEGAASALSGFGQAAQAAWAEIQPLLIQLGPIAADAFNGLRGFAAGAAPVLSTTAGALADVAGAALSVAGPVVSVSAAIGSIPGVAQGATAALLTLGAAFVGLKGVSAATGLMRLGTAAAASAANVGKMAAVTSTVTAVMPRAGAALAALASPAGIAALAVGGLTAGLVLLATNGTSAAERTAQAMQRVADASRDADSAMRGFTSAAQGLKDAVINEEAALLAKQRAQQRVNQLNAEGKKGTLDYRQAVNDLARASNEYNKSRAQTGRSAVQARDEMLGVAKAYAKFANDLDAGKSTLAEQISTVKALAKTMNLSESATESLVGKWRSLDSQGASAAEKMNAFRATIRTTADQMREAGKVKLAEELDKIGRLDTRGLIEFGDRVAALEGQGMKPIQAIRKALSEIKPPKNIKLDLKDQVTPKADAAGRAIARVKQRTPAVLQAQDLVSPQIPGIQARIDSIRGKTVTITVRPNFPQGSPRVYEIPELLRDIRSKTVDVTVRPHGTAQLQELAAVASGDLSGLRKRFGGGSLDPIREALGAAGGILIRADLDVANLPEVLAEAREVGVSIGGTFARALATERTALARTVGQSNELIRRIEQLRSLTEQLGRAQAAQRSAAKGKNNGDERREAAATLARIQQQIAQAQAAFRKLAGGQGAPEALAAFDRKLAEQIRKLGARAQDLREKAEELRAAKERAFEAFSAATLGAFDADTRRMLDGVASAYQDGFRQIGGTFELVPGLFRQLTERIQAEAGGLREAMQGELTFIDKATKAQSKVIERAAQAQTKALDKVFGIQSKALEARQSAEMAAIEERGRALTASEQALANLRANRSAATIARNVAEAEASLREAYAKGMPKAEIQRRMREVEDARFAEQEAGLEKAAGAERSARDAQTAALRALAQYRHDAERESLAEVQDIVRQAHQDRIDSDRDAYQEQIDALRKSIEDRYGILIDGLERSGEAERIYLDGRLSAETTAMEDRREAERRGLEASLDQWRTHFNRLGVVVGNGNAEALAQINAFAGRFQASGRNLGQEIADGLRNAYPALKSAAKGAGVILRDFLQLNSPAKEGPLSTLDTWWDKFAPTLIGGADMGSVEAMLTHYADPMRGGSSMPAGGGYGEMHIHIHDQTLAGMSREQARRVADQIGPALDRRVTARIPG